MGQKAFVSEFIRHLGEISQEFPDERAGKANQLYSIGDGVRGAFSVFFSQSASFLAHQEDVLRRHKKSNAHTVFQMGQIPSDNHIRNLLDPVSPDYLETSYLKLWGDLMTEGQLSQFQVMGKRLLVGLDGIRFQGSTKISCDQCRQKQIDETTHYEHWALTALVVHPDQPHVLPLPPEFLVPQDGSEKQDSELAAAKRWLPKRQKWLQAQQAILLGDDLFSHQPFCELVLEAKLDFILVCKPSSHTTLYQWIEGMERGEKLATITHRVWNGRHGEIWTYRYVEDVPLRLGEDSLFVNWCDLTITHELDGTQIYHNSFVTSLPLDDDTVKIVTQSGRTRWKHENEGHNILTTRGYHIKHNFGHGQKHLANFLFSLNLLAFFLHTLLHIADEIYQLLRAELRARYIFFDDIRALMRYLIFDTWEEMLLFMATRLELVDPP